jgi:hypothetical protein
LFAKLLKIYEFFSKCSPNRPPKKLEIAVGTGEVRDAMASGEGL